jgi:hypothetical protein
MGVGLGSNVTNPKGPVSRLLIRSSLYIRMDRPRREDYLSPHCPSYEAGVSLLEKWVIVPSPTSRTVQRFCFRNMTGYKNSL